MCNYPISALCRWVVLPLVIVAMPLADWSPCAWAQAAEPSSDVSACVEGERLFREQQHDLAEPLLRQCLAEAGERADALLYLTVITVSGERFTEALEWGRKAVATAPESPDARYWYGRALLETGDVVGAKEQWEAGLGFSAQHIGLLEGLARLSIKEGADSKAYGLLVQMQRLGFDEPWVHRLLSELSSNKGLWAASWRHWQDYLERVQENSDDLITAGELGILAGDTEGAIMFCRRAVELEPSAAAYGALGEALFAAKHHDEAIVALQHAIDLDQEEPRYHFNIANALEIEGRVDEAEPHFQRYIELASEDPVGRLNYAVHLNKQGRSEEALNQTRAAVAVDPSLLTARIMEAQLLEVLGLYGEAMGVIDTMLTVATENREQLVSWRDQLALDLAEQRAASEEGKFQLLHIVLADSVAVTLVQQDLAQGVDFATLAVRYSVGTSAAEGGNIGWVAPADMIEPLRSAIAALEPGEISPIIESRELYHIFKRIH